jgi:hypothetical protein
MSEIEIIVKQYPSGQLRPKVMQKAGTTTYGVVTGDKQNLEIARFAGHFGTNADVATLTAAIDTAMATGGVVLR